MTKNILVHSSKRFFVLLVIPLTLVGADANRVISYKYGLRDLPVEIKLEIIKKSDHPEKAFACMRVLSKEMNKQWSEVDLFYKVVPFIAQRRGKSDITVAVELALPEYIAFQLADKSLNPKVFSCLGLEPRFLSLDLCKRLLEDRGFYTEALLHSVSTMEVPRLLELLKLHRIFKCGDQAVLDSSLDSVIDTFISIKRSDSYYRKKKRFLQLMICDKAGIDLASLPGHIHDDTILKPCSLLVSLGATIDMLYKRILTTDRQLLIDILSSILKQNDTFDYERHLPACSNKVKYCLSCWWATSFEIQNSSYVPNDIKEKFAKKINLFNLCKVIDDLITAGARPNKTHSKYMDCKWFLFDILRDRNQQGAIDLRYC